MYEVKVIKSPWIPRIPDLALRNILGMVANELILQRTGYVVHGKATITEPLALCLLGPSQSLPYFAPVATVRIGDCTPENTKTARLNALLHLRIGKTRREASNIELIGEDQQLASGASARARGVIVGIDGPKMDQIALDIASLAARKCSEKINAALRRP